MILVLSPSIILPHPGCQEVGHGEVVHYQLGVDLKKKTARNRRTECMTSKHILVQQQVYTHTVHDLVSEPQLPWLQTAMHIQHIGLDIESESHPVYMLCYIHLNVNTGCYG